MTARELKLIDSIKNSASNVVVAACFLSGVAFFDYLLFIPAISFILIGLTVVKWRSAVIAFLGLIISICFIFYLSNDLSQLGLTKLALFGWVCFSSAHAIVKSIMLNRVQRKTHI